MLSAGRARKLAEARCRTGEPTWFGAEGLASVGFNDLTPAVARRLGAAFGVTLRNDGPRSSTASDSPSAAIGFDGRAEAVPLLVAVAEGLRWAGCETIDLGPVTAPCVARAVDNLGATGGLLVGNPSGESHSVGAKFWHCGGRPLSAGDGLEDVERAFRTGVDRPVRRHGPMRRSQAEEPYLETLAERFHALRPLRFVMRTSSEPARRYLETLVRPVACRALTAAVPRDRLTEEVARAAADFGVSIEDDGERCRVVDERGEAVAPGRLALLLARHLGRRRGGGLVVLDAELHAALCEPLLGRNVHTFVAGPTRAEFHRAMRDHDAGLGADASGRLWFSEAGPPGADALAALSLLLEALSRSDRPLSEVLDREARLV